MPGDVWTVLAAVMAVIVPRIGSAFVEILAWRCCGAGVVVGDGDWRQSVSHG